MNWNEAVKAAIDAIASGLHTTSDFVWPILVRQSYVDGLRDVVAGPTLIAVGLWFWKKCRESYAKDDYQSDRITPVTGILGTIVLILGSVYLYSAIGELVNPQYYAIQHVLDAIGGHKP